MYGLCKVHKKNFSGKCPPFRPILSAIGTCTYNLAKYFVPILNDHTHNDFVLKDSFSFCDDIRKQDASLYMASFDVDALFTNIPLTETIDICVNLLYHNKRKVNGLLRKDFRSLLELATKKSCFLFNGVYYSQLDGVAMGSPLGPTFANFFLCYYETIWLSECPPEFKPVYYKRYMDDVICLFRDQSHVLQFESYLNARHENITFTHEVEENNKLAFLDVQVTREGDYFVTSIYRVPSFSGVYTNFNSFTPMKYKHGLLFTLLHRAFTISSDYKTFHEEVCKLKNIWLKNAYPLFLIDKCIYKFLDKLFNKNKVAASGEPSTSKQNILFSLPYLGKHSLLLRKKIINILKSCSPHIKVNIIFSSKFRISNMISFKDRIPTFLNSLVIYKFKCGHCNASYIGQTKRHLQVRSYEHLGYSIATNKKLKWNKSKSTAVLEHCVECSHSNDISNFEIIGRADSNFHCQLKESILIMRDKPVLNNNVTSTPLSLFQ